MSRDETPAAEGLLDMDGLFTPEERQLLLKRLGSLFAWVGAHLPRRLELEGRPVEVQRLLAKLTGTREPTPAQLEQARWLERVLRARERELEQRLATAPLQEVEALRLFQEARGLLRALMQLRELGRESEPYAQAALKAKLADEKRWLGLLRAVGRPV